MPVASAAPRRLMQRLFSPFMTNSTTPALLGWQYRSGGRLTARPAPVMSSLFLSFVVHRKYRFFRPKRAHIVLTNVACLSRGDTGRATGWYFSRAMWLTNHANDVGVVIGPGKGAVGIVTMIVMFPRLKLRWGASPADPRQASR